MFSKQKIYYILGLLCVLLLPYIYKNFPYKEQLKIISGYTYSLYQKHFSHLEFTPLKFEQNQNYSAKIPKIIHYVWLGSKELPKDVQTTLKTWRKYAPDYVIKRWDETNCDINATELTAFAYQNKNFDIVSDWCRFVALEKEGGLYLDTDHRLSAPLSSLSFSDFNLVLENNSRFSASFIATIPHHPIFRQLLNKNLWKGQDIVNNSPLRLTEAVLHYFQPVNFKIRATQSLTIYPPNFIMFNYGGSENVARHLYASGKKKFSENSEWYQSIFEENLNYFFYHLAGMILIPNEKGLFYDYFSKKEYLLEKSGHTIIRITPQHGKNFSDYFCYYNICYKLY